MTRVIWVGSIFRHNEIAMRSDHIVSNRISSNLIGRGLRSNRAMRLDAMRLLKTLLLSTDLLVSLVRLPFHFSFVHRDGNSVASNPGECFIRFSCNLGISSLASDPSFTQSQSMALQLLPKEVISQP